jgi:hypothetical protein
VRNDRSREVEALEAVLPEVAAEPPPVVDLLPWRGRGNIIAAAGVVLVDMVVRR